MACLPEFTRDFWFEPLAPEAAPPRLTPPPVRMGLAVDAVERMPGPWVALELPPPGAHIRARDGFGFVTTGQTVHDLRAPAAFRVLAVNRRAVENPEIARLSPRVEGWLLEIELLEAGAAT
jgi:glycine cleavage system H lipoate-binding protein